MPTAKSAIKLSPVSPDLWLTIIFQLLLEATFEDLESIEEIGPIVAESIIEFWNEESNKNIANACFELGVKLEKNNETEVQTLSGKIFVFTGALEQFSRSKAKEMVEKFGGRASESVSKNTDYVIAGPGAGYKKRKAKELGIDILTEEEFFKLMKI